jgi:hypothetical protein
MSHILQENFQLKRLDLGGKTVFSVTCSVTGGAITLEFIRFTGV